MEKQDLQAGVFISDSWCFTQTDNMWDESIWNKSLHSAMIWW